MSPSVCLSPSLIQCLSAHLGGGLGQQPWGPLRIRAGHNPAGRLPRGPLVGQGVWGVSMGTKTLWLGPGLAGKAWKPSDGCLSPHLASLCLAPAGSWGWRTRSHDFGNARCWLREQAGPEGTTALSSWEPSLIPGKPLQWGPQTWWDPQVGKLRACRMDTLSSPSRFLALVQHCCPQLPV